MTESERQRKYLEYISSDIYWIEKRNECIEAMTEQQCREALKEEMYYNRKYQTEELNTRNKYILMRELYHRLLVKQCNQ